MARRVSCRWVACVLVLASTGWHGAIAQTCFGAGGPTDSDEGEEALPDMNFVKSQAEVGRATSQTQLGDFYLASSDFTNVVIWYRKAADQGHVPAQLSLAGCMMSGRGAAKDASGAARLLRQAAVQIEFHDNACKATTLGPVATRTATKVAAQSIVITKEAPANPAHALTTPAVLQTNLPPVTAVQKNAIRISRVDTLAVTDAMPQEVRPFGGHPSDSP